MRSPNHTTWELLCYEGWLRDNSFNTTEVLWNLSTLLGFKSHSVPVTLICSRFNTLKRPFRAIFRKKDRTYYFWLTATYEAGKQQWSLVSLLSIDC